MSYYNPWLKPFQAGFARSAAGRGAMTLVQMDPTNVPLAKIAAGQYDAYLRSYATAIKDFGGHVILSFGHEMNGYWYSWGNLSTQPAVFVAAWRHVVTLFRAAGAGNVTWLWAVNVTDQTTEIPNPAPWWPGGSYVNWVGIDGYYDSPLARFAQVFGPTIVDVRSLTKDPIFISETGVKPAAGHRQRSSTFLPASGPMACSDSYGSTRITVATIGVFQARRPLPHSGSRPKRSSSRRKVNAGLAASRPRLLPSRSCRDRVSHGPVAALETSPAASHRDAVLRSAPRRRSRRLKH